MFLLQPRPAELAAILATLDGNDFSSIHITTQQLFGQAVKALQSGDPSKLDNVLVVMRRLGKDAKLEDDESLFECAIAAKISQFQLGYNTAYDWTREGG